MGKKKNLFSVLKRLFISDTNSKPDKKEKRKSRWIFRLLKMKQRLPPLSAPEIPPHDLQLQHKESQDTSESNNLEANNLQVSHQDYAAIRIQAVFRGYLARKALRALKGVVKLQALIRGWAVRKQAIKTLKCLQSIVNIQLEVCSNRSERNNNTLHCQDIKVDINSQKRWNDSILTKEESNSIYLSKQEASIKRERIKEYYLNHRRSAETERDKAYGRRRYWLEQWVDAQLAKQDYLTNFDTNSSANPSNKDEVGGRDVNSRRHRKQRSIGNESSFPNSPVVPTYMAFTESAKAKARSTSSPRLRPVSLDGCSDVTSPYKHKYSPISSINSELTSRSWIPNHNGTSRSPGLKGSPGPVKSITSIKDFHLQGIHQ